MFHLFNAKKIKQRCAVTNKTIRRDIRMLKYMISSYADSGKDHIEVSYRDSEWRTRYYWMNYFIERGFKVVNKSSASKVDSITISW